MRSCTRNSFIQNFYIFSKDNKCIVIIELSYPKRQHIFVHPPLPSPNTILLWKDKFTAPIFQFYPPIKRHFISLNISSALSRAQTELKSYLVHRGIEINPRSKERNSKSFDRQNDLSAGKSIDPCSLFPETLFLDEFVFPFPPPFSSLFPFPSLFFLSKRTFTFPPYIDIETEFLSRASIPRSVILKHEVIKQGRRTAKRDERRSVSVFREMYKHTRKRSIWLIDPPPYRSIMPRMKIPHCWHVLKNYLWPRCEKRRSVSMRFHETEMANGFG